MGALSFLSQGLDRHTLQGVALCAGGNVLISIALNIQKLAHQRIEKKKQQKNHEETPLIQHDHTTRTNLYDHTNGSVKDLYKHQDDSSTNFLKKPLWWLGILLMAGGELGNFASYSFAPASVVAPLGTVALIANCFFAPLILKEPFQRSDLWGICLSILGACTVVVSSKQSSGQLQPDELSRAITSVPFIVYVCITIPLFLMLVWLSTTKYGDQYIAVDVGATALAGGYTVLATKATASLFTSMWFDIFRYPVMYAVLAVLIATAITQIQFLNKALQRFDSQEVIPANFVSFTISAIVGSSVLYRDFESTTFQQALNFIFGCALVFLGVRLLTKSRSDAQKKDAASHEDAALPKIIIAPEDVDDETLDNLSKPVAVVNSKKAQHLLSHLVPSSPRKSSTSAGFLLIMDQQDRVSVNSLPLQRQSSRSEEGV